MILKGTGQNVLSGRLLVAGAYSDVGVAMSLKDEGNNVFTMTLVDDELRPHDYVPPTRTFTGSFDTEKSTLSLKSEATGEWVSWELPGGYKAIFTSNIYHCVVVPTPVGTPTPSPSGGGSTPTPTPTPAPTAAPITGGFVGVNSMEMVVPVAPAEIVLAPLAVPTPAPIPRPSPTVKAPGSRLMSCGMMAAWKEDWARMSGSF